MTQTIEDKIVPLYEGWDTPYKMLYKNAPQIYQKEKDAFYEIFNSVGKDPKDYYFQGNRRLVDIRDNRIYYLDASEINLKKISKSIGKLKNLEFLDLSKTLLTEIPKEIKELKNLEWLYLHDNQITEIPEEMEELYNLKRMYIYNNPLSEKSKEFLKKLNKKGVEI